MPGSDLPRVPMPSLALQPWLISIGLGVYAQAFDDEGFGSVEVRRATPPRRIRTRVAQGCCLPPQ